MQLTSLLEELPGQLDLVVAQCSGEPAELLAELLPDLLTDRHVRLFRGMSLASDYLPHTPTLDVCSTGVLGTNRELWERGQLDVVPEGVSRVPQYLRDALIPNDLLLLRATRTADGRLASGLVNDYVPAALESATRIAVQLVEDPVLPGAPMLDRVDVVVERTAPTPQLPPSRPRAADEQIAAHVAGLVEDGNTVQLGIGSLATSIARALARVRRDLGVHTGLIDDAVLDLIDSGAVTNAGKPEDEGRSVTPIVMGSARLYRRVAQRDDIVMRPVDHTNDASVIGRIDGFIAINSALQVDLLGQVNAEVIGGVRRGAVGGQREFFAGARHSRGGLAVTVLRSTAVGGRVSTIVPRLEDGVVTVPAGEVDVVVTEHGTADLRGATTLERARRLAEVAHPDFRRDLLERLEKDERIGHCSDRTVTKPRTH